MLLLEHATDLPFLSTIRLDHGKSHRKSRDLSNIQAEYNLGDGVYASTVEVLGDARLVMQGWAQITVSATTMAMEFSPAPPMVTLVAGV